MNDEHLFSKLRGDLVNKLRKKNITDKAVMVAIKKIPRHRFVDDLLVPHAYEDRPCPIAEGQTISQPYTVAYQTSLLEVKPTDKVLEIGTGSGYQTAVLMELGATVYSIERHRGLSLQAHALLSELGYSPHLFCGDGCEGLLEHAPFTKILVTAGAEQVPQMLLAQLAGGGRMVIPVGDSQGQEMQVIERIAHNHYHTTHHGRFLFVPLIPGSRGV